MTPAERAVRDEPLVTFLEQVRRFAERHIDALAFDRAGGLPAGLLDRLAELGVFGISIPTRWGGSDLGLPGTCAVVEELARHDRSVATTVGLHVGLGTRAIVAFGSSELKDLALPGLAVGRGLAAFATTEPSSGSDLGSLRTTAVPSGDSLILEGEKCFVTNGATAEWITVTASTPGLGGARRGQSLLLVHAGDSGLVRGAEERKMGLRASSTTSLAFDDLALPMDRVIGTPGRGGEQLGPVLARGRTVLAAGANGTAKAALDATVEYVGWRRQFGRTLGSMPVVRDQVADMTARLYAMRALVTRAAAERDDAGLEEWSLAAKVFCSEGSGRICDTALQLHGGTGFIEDSGLPLLVRDARVTRIFEGANDVLCTRLGALECARRSERVADVRDALVAEHGLALYRRPALLHRLGRLSVLRRARDAALAAAAEDPDPRGARLAGRFVATLEARGAGTP